MMMIAGIFNPDVQNVKRQPEVDGMVQSDLTADLFNKWKLTAGYSHASVTLRRKEYFE